MMKKFLFVVIISIINMIVMNHVLAVCECKYNGDANAGQSGLSSTIGNKGYLTIKIEGNNIEPVSGDINDIIDPYIDPKWTYEEIIKQMNGGCQAIVTLCQLNNRDFGTAGRFLIMNSTLEATLVNMGTITLPRKTTIGTIVDIDYSYGNCARFSLDNSESTCGDVTPVYKCESYDNYYKKMDDYYDDYKECRDKGSSSKCFKEHQDYLEAKDNITDYCNTLFNHLDQDNSCLQNCLGLADEIEQQFNNVKDNCGLSDRLIKYVQNIMKWVKYVVPALVIILGMIDFIRAIGSNSDDEMKKAQQRFIKRLIVAALIFLIPFVIEFLLKAFRLGSNNPFCGLY